VFRVWLIRRVLNWMLGFVALLHLRSSGLQAIQRYRYFHTFSSSLFYVHYDSQFSLAVSWQRIFQSHWHFKSHVKSSCHSLIPFWPFLLNRLRLPFPELDPVLFRLLFRTPCNSASIPPVLPNTSYNHQERTSGKHGLLLLRMRVYWSLPSNRRPIFERFGFLGMS
jgi:hypothetical protein